MKLKKEWKILFSIMIILIDVLFYINSNTLGILAQNSKFYLIMTLLGWTWLLFFSSVLLYCIWDN